MNPNYLSLFYVCLIDVKTLWRWSKKDGNT